MSRWFALKGVLVLIALLAVVSLAAAACGDGDGDGDKPTIVFSDLTWDSALVQNRIAQFIVENGYGYETDVIAGDTVPNFEGLLKGDIHVDMEVWLPNQQAAWDDAIAGGQVVPVGESLGQDWQSAFVIPQYLADQHPGLKTVEDLKKPEFNELFVTPDSRGKARLVSCVTGWSCEQVNAAQIEAYGLNDYVEVVNPGSGSALFEDLQGQYDREQPWLGYMWGTADPGLTLDLVRLEEPPYSDECWATTKQCGYEDATILIAVHPSLTTDAPDVVDFLRNWGFNIERYKTVAQHRSANPDLEIQDAAIWWLQGNESVWSGWVPSDVAEKVSDALDDA